MRPGVGLYNRRSPRNGSRKYVARRITPSTTSETVVIAATIDTQTKVLVTADAAMSAGSRGLPAEGVVAFVPHAGSGRGVGIDTLSG